MLFQTSKALRQEISADDTVLEKIDFFRILLLWLFAIFCHDYSVTIFVFIFYFKIEVLIWFLPVFQQPANMR